MTKVKVISDECVEFEDGSKLFSEHMQECCEDHYLDFSTLQIGEMENLEFDLSGGSFFERVPDYGIRLVPVNGFPVSIPGYGNNNGYYSSDMNLVLQMSDGTSRTFDITECQDY